MSDQPEEFHCNPIGAVCGAGGLAGVWPETRRRGRRRHTCVRALTSGAGHVRCETVYAHATTTRIVLPPATETPS